MFSVYQGTLILCQRKKKKKVEPPIATRKVIQIMKSGRFFLVESAIQGFGFRNLVD